MNLRMVLEHLYLVAVSCFFVILSGVPLGIFTYYHPKVGKVILTAVDLMQTVPVLAVMGLLMTVFGANGLTVIIAMVLYLLLPVVRNTDTGLKNVSAVYKETADAMGDESMGKAEICGDSNGFSIYPDRDPDCGSYGSWCRCIWHFCGRRWSWKRSVSGNSNSELRNDLQGDICSDGHVHGI